MRIAYFDCFSGTSGDTILGALLAQATGVPAVTAPPIRAAVTAAGAATSLAGEESADFRAAPGGDVPASGTPMPAAQSPPSILAPLSSSPASVAPRPAVAEQNQLPSLTPASPAGDGPKRTHLVASGETVSTIA